MVQRNREPLEAGLRVAVLGGRLKTTTSSARRRRMRFDSGAPREVPIRAPPCPAAASSDGSAPPHSRESSHSRATDLRGILAFVPLRLPGVNQGERASGHQQQGTGNASASDSKPCHPTSIRHHRERKALQHAAIRARGHPLDMGVSQALTMPRNAPIVTRNEITSAVRVRSSALHFLTICRRTGKKKEAANSPGLWYTSSIIKPRCGRAFYVSPRCSLCILS
jgi:hypothetical protein